MTKALQTSLGGGIQACRFSTEGLPPERRFLEWKSSISVLFEVELDVSRAGDPFTAELETYRIEQLLLARCRTDTQLFRRSALKISSDGLDHYMVQVLTRGSIELPDTGEIVRPGDIYVMDMAAPLTSVDRDVDYLTLVIPRLLLEPRLTRPQEHHLRIIEREKPMAQVLCNLMTLLHSVVGRMSATEGAAAMEAALRLVEGALNGEAPRQGSPVEGAMDHAFLLAAKRFIEARLQDRGLRPETIAAAIGVSRKRLYSLFEPYGGVANYVRTRRLKRSTQDLVDPRNFHRRIYDIAHDWGFRDDAEFSRAFRRAYAMTPRQARSLQTAVLSRNGSIARAYEYWLLELAS